MGSEGQQPFLSPEAPEEVAEQVTTGRLRTAEEMRDWIARDYGADYTVGGVYTLLRRRAFHISRVVE